MRGFVGAGKLRAQGVAFEAKVADVVSQRGNEEVDFAVARLSFDADAANFGGDGFGCCRGDCIPAIRMPWRGKSARWFAPGGSVVRHPGRCPG